MRSILSRLCQVVDAKESWIYREFARPCKICPEGFLLKHPWLQNRSMTRRSRQKLTLILWQNLLSCNLLMLYVISL
ncbi:hypothetical protein Naga_100385g4 [Nannochloropsis gaditana]|uniref:Uncharacterized protein n=1 Tax=Nannochloropsis gaditana TaxID=72520 RepID=W7T0V7_9STRA|nr:hypothetical protein Naga_100385g4 [Nannochloropsis gaditana]